MTRARLAAVGLFVLCGVALAVFTIVSFGAIDPFRHDTSAEIVFDGPVSGLAVGAPVTFRGVPVGHVTSTFCSETAMSWSAARRGAG